MQTEQRRLSIAFATLAILFVSQAVLAADEHTTATAATSPEAVKAQGPQLRSFAENFKCKDPTYQWAFEHLPSFYDANEVEKKQSRSSQNPRLGGGSDNERLFRGVRAEDMSPTLILKILLHDHDALFYGSTMLRRLNPTNDASYKSTIEQMNEFIHSKVQNKDGTMNFYDPDEVWLMDQPHPWSAPLVWTAPDHDTTISYGPYTYWIHEVTPRGLDVTRHQIYTRGSSHLPARDGEEVILPTEIPPWDVEGFEVGTRPGGSEYKLNKVTSFKNPCDSLGVEVEVNSHTVAYIVPCTSSVCPTPDRSMLPAGSSFDQLYSTLTGLQVGGQKLMLVSADTFKAMRNPASLARMPLATVVNLYDSLPPELRQNIPLWKKILLEHGHEDPASALALYRKNPLFKEFKAEWSRILSLKLAQKWRPNADQAQDFLSLAETIDIPAADLDAYMLGILKPSNPAVVRAIAQYGTDHTLSPTLNTALTEAVAKMDGGDLLKVQLASHGPLQPTAANFAALGAAWQKNLNTMGFFDDLLGNETQKARLIEGAFATLPTDALKNLNWTVLRLQIEKAVPSAAPKAALWTRLIASGFDKDALNPHHFDLNLLPQGLSEAQLLSIINASWRSALREGTANHVAYYAQGIPKQFENIPNLASGVSENAVKQFFAKTLSDPGLLNGYRASAALRLVNASDQKTFFRDIYSGPEAGSAPLSINDPQTQITRAQIRAAAASSLSAYYLHRVLYENDAIQAAVLHDYAVYYGQKLADDWKNPEIKKSFLDRFEWTSNENLVTIGENLLKSETDPALKASIQRTLEIIRADWPKTAR